MVEEQDAAERREGLIMASKHSNGYACARRGSGCMNEGGLCAFAPVLSTITAVPLFD